MFLCNAETGAAHSEDLAKTKRAEELEALERRLDQRWEAKLKAGLDSLRAELLAEIRREEPEQDEPGGASPGQLRSRANTIRRTPSSATSVSDEEYSFKESIWDASVFIGMPHLGRAGSGLVLLCLLVNIIVQVIFTLIVMNNLAESEFSPEDLAGLSAWRLKIGHDEKYVSASVAYSLVDRVCQDDTSLEMATEQINKLRLIKEYLPDIDNQGPWEFTAQNIANSFLRGETMCVLAMTIWFLAISREISSVFDFIGAFRLLPSGSVTEIIHADDGVALKAISHSRTLLVAFLAFLRLTIAVFLLIIGGLYLCATTSLADLLLNAVALEMVVSIDELVYETMAPRVVMDLISNMGPMAMRPWKRWRSADAKSMLMFPILAGLLAGFGIFGLQATVENLKDAHGRMCNGTRNFSYNIDGLGMVHLRGLPSFVQAQAHNVSSYIDQAVQEVRDRAKPEEWQYMLLEGGPPTLEATILEIYAPVDRRHCHNALDTHGFDINDEVPLTYRNQWRVWPRWLQNHLGRDEPITSCEDIKEHCTFIEGWDSRTVKVMRALCPKTCGCNLLTTGSWVSSRVQGCPTVCEEYKGEDVPDQWPCEDTNRTAQDDSRARTMETWMGEILTLYPTDPNVAYVVDMWRTHGCQGIMSVLGDEALCSSSIPATGPGYLVSADALDKQAGFFFKILTYMCPVSCNCGGLDEWRQPASKEVCPSQCSCSWPFNESIPEWAPPEECIVPNPYDLGPSSPVQATPRCCHLMAQATTALQPLAAARGAGVEPDAAATEYFALVAETICTPCRKECLGILDNVTFPGDIFGGGTIADVFTRPTFEILCTLRRRLLQGGALTTALGSSQQDAGMQHRRTNGSRARAQ